MKKTTLIFILFLIKSLNSYSQYLIDDDFKKNIYYDKIKLIKTNIYDYYSATNEVDIKEFEKVRFNENGKITRLSRYNSVGKIIPYEIFYTYDNNGFLISIEKADNENKRYSKTLFMNNENGFPIKSTLYENGNYYSEINYEYNSFNQCIKETHITADFGKEYPTYVINTYNSKSNKISVLYMDVNGIVTGNNSYEYNDKNQLIKETVQYGQLKPNISIFEYNEFGHIIKESTFDKDDKLKVLFIYEYSYDSHKNWLSQKEIHKGQTLKIRSIDYY